LGWQERQDYAKEELVAEIGAAMLMQQYGIDPNVPMMADYVRGWLRALEDDHSLIIGAAQQAQKACDRVTGWAFVEEKSEQEEAA
jgi:antirestriction protein ArdC